MLIKFIGENTLKNRGYLHEFTILVIGFFLAFYMQSSIADYVIDADDAVSIKVYGYDDLTTETRVSDQGIIVFPLIGEVKIGGKSPLEAGRTITQQLGNGGFIKNAQVTVVILDFKSQQVSILGQVNHPGQYPLEFPRSLVDVIAMAGGISSMGEDRVIITRHQDGKALKEEVDLRKTLEYPETSKIVKIEKGDIVYVPKAPVFYIHGEVQKPGSYRLEPNMSVAQAISVGGGVTPRGTLRGINIERRNQKGVTKSIDAELSDPVLSNDVIVVDESLF